MLDVLNFSYSRVCGGSPSALISLNPVHNHHRFIYISFKQLGGLMRILKPEFQSPKVSTLNSKNSIGDIIPNEPTIFAHPASGVKYTVNLTDDFDKPHTFDQVVALLSTATEEDEIVFNINSAGGYIDSLNMLLGWKAVCPARQVHVLMGNASSAASAFFLSKADQYVVGSNSTMMIHEFQSGVYGTNSNNDRRNAHSRVECIKFIQNTYSDFLTEHEIEEVLKGVEIYLSSQEITERLASRLSKDSDTEGVIDFDAELEAFKEYLTTLNKAEIQAELYELQRFQEAAMAALVE